MQNNPSQCLFTLDCPENTWNNSVFLHRLSFAMDVSLLYQEDSTVQLFTSEVAILEWSETVIQNIEYLEKNADFLHMTSLNSFIKKTKNFEEHLAILDSKKEETVMLHHIKILHNMFTIIECTSYTKLIYKKLHDRNYSLKFT